MYVLALPRSSIGKKIIMALTGLIGVGFLVLHMYGNLKAFLGREYFNEYAEALRNFGTPVLGHLHLLTVIRLVLLVAVVLHIWAAVTLKQRSWQARPTRYAVRKHVQADYASVTMFWGGLTIFFFLLYHLAHFTWGVPVVTSDFVRSDAYHNLVMGFQSIPVTLFYIIAVVVLGFHLYHGGWSLFQTMGLSDENTEKPLRALSVALAIGLTVGFLVVPLAVLAGVIHE